jgi:hypothetical protein
MAAVANTARIINITCDGVAPGTSIRKMRKADAFVFARLVGFLLFVLGYEASPRQYQFPARQEHGRTPWSDRFAR